MFMWIIFAIFSCVSGIECPDRWMSFRGSCYLFGQDHVHFTEAEHFCRQHNAHLVKVETRIENLFVKDVLNDFTCGSDNYWLGMTDETVEGIWQWFVDNTDVSFTDWGPTEPQDNGGGEDCAVFAQHGHFQWSDVPCTQSFKAICELSEQVGDVENIIG